MLGVGRLHSFPRSMDPESPPFRDHLTPEPQAPLRLPLPPPVRRVVPRPQEPRNGVFAFDVTTLVMTFALFMGSAQRSGWYVALSGIILLDVVAILVGLTSSGSYGRYFRSDRQYAAMRFFAASFSVVTITFRGDVVVLMLWMALSLVPHFLALMIPWSAGSGTR